MKNIASHFYAPPQHTPQHTLPEKQPKCNNTVHTFVKFRENPDDVIRTEFQKFLKPPGFHLIVIFL